MYHITPYTRAKAKDLGVEVRPSTKKGKKIDVFLGDKLLHSIGDLKYKDYPTYLREEGKEKADERRRLYHLRHTRTGLGEKLALYLLW